MTPEEIETELAAKDAWMAENWSVEGLHETALQAIRALYARTSNGDAEAVHSLVSLASYITGALDFTQKQTHEALPGFQAVSEAAADSYLWPAVIPAVEEMRPQAALESVPLGLGSNLPVRAEKRKGRGKTRAFVNSGQTGFAFNVFCSLEARRGENGLADFALESLPAWIAAGRELVLSMPDLFPDTVEVRSAIKARISKQGQAEEPARKHVIEKRLKDGFRQLLKA
jgi:hypothetical protein